MKPGVETLLLPIYQLTTTFVPTLHLHFSKLPGSCFCSNFNQLLLALCIPSTVIKKYWKHGFIVQFKHAELKHETLKGETSDGLALMAAS